MLYKTKNHSSEMEEKLKTDADKFNYIQLVVYNHTPGIN